MKPKMWWFKRSSWPHLLARWLMLYATVGYVLLPTAVVWANPTGEQVVGGSATFERQGNTLTINQATDRLAVNWQDFSIAAGEATHFNMPSAASIALNRVLGGNPSQIYGTLSSNGNIILVNNAGIFVGPGGVVNAASFVGSTLDIDPGQFMNGGQGGYQLHGNSYAPIVNQGNITAEKGDVFLIAQKVENRGTISAPNGRAALIGAGRESDRTEVVLHEVGGSGFAVRVAQLEGEAAQGMNGDLPDGEELLNEGNIAAAQAELSASGNIYALAIKNTGTIRAKAVVANADGTVRLDGGLGDVRNAGTLIAKNAGDEATAAGGKIEVTGQNVTASPESIITAAGGERGGDGGRVKIDSTDTTIVQGEVDVSAPAANAKGGKVELLGERVGLFDGAKVDASGGAGGGTVLVGGDYLGGQTPKAELKDLAKQEAEPVKNAKATVMADTAEIKADATVNGDGGKIVLWSDDYTGFYGELFARGGPEGGNGGFIETSSKNNLQAFGLVDASAILGKSGHWLLDPTSLTVSTGGNVNGSFTGTPAVSWTTSPDPASTSGAAYANATVGITPLLTALGLGSVTVSTGSTGSGTGFIIVDGAITNTGNANALNLIATTQITINQPITLAGNISFNANGGAITTNAYISSTAGTVSMIAGGGAITLNGSVTADAGILGRSSGAIDINGAVTMTGNGTIQLIAAGDVTGPGLISLSPTGGLSIDTTGAVNLSVTAGPVAVNTSGNITLFGPGAGTTTVGLVNGINGLSGADVSLTAGTIELGGAPVDATGDFTALASAINFVAPSNRIAPAVTSGGNQTYQGPITLSANTVLNSSGNMRFADTIDGGFSLLLLVQGFTDLLDQVGGNTPLASFRQEGGLINFLSPISPQIVTTGSITFDGANLVLWSNTSFSSGADLIVLGTINSSAGDVPVTLSATAAGNLILDGAVGGTAALGALNVTATGGQIAINQGVTTLPGNTPLNPGANGSISLSAGGAVVLAGPIDTRGGLSRDTLIGGNVTVNSGGGPNQNIQIESNINTRGGSITFQDPVFFTGASILDTTAGNVAGLINFNDTTDGSALATIRGGTAQVTFGDAVGSQNPFDLAITSAGGVLFNGSVLLSSGASTLTSLAGAVSFASTIDKLGGNLTMDLGTQALTFGGTVGATNPFGLVVNSSGAVSLNGATRMGGAFTFNNLSGAFQASESIEGGFALTINPVNSAATVTLGDLGTKVVGGVETLVPLASLTLGNGNAAVFLNGNIATAGGAIRFGSPVTANQSIALDSTARGATGGGMFFLNTFQGATGAENLTIRAGQGALTFGDAISSFDLFNVASAGSMDFTNNGLVSAGTINVQAAINSQRTVALTSTSGGITINGGLSARPSNSSGIGGTTTVISAGDVTISGLVDVSGRSGTFVVFSPDGSSSATVATVGFKGGTTSISATGSVLIGSINANGGNNFATGGNGGDGGVVTISFGSGLAVSTIQANGGKDGTLGGNGGTISITRTGATGGFNGGSFSATGGDGFNNGGAGGTITLASALGDLQAPTSYLTQGGQATLGDAATRNLFAGLGGTVSLQAAAGSVYFQNQTLTLQGDSRLAVNAGTSLVLATDLVNRSGGVVITSNENALRNDRRGALDLRYGSGEFFMPSSAYLVSQGGAVKIYSLTAGAGAIGISGINTVGRNVNGGSIEVQQESGSVLGSVTVAGALETFGGVPTSPEYGRNGGSVKVSGTTVLVNRINTSGSASLATATSPAFGGAGGDVVINGTTITLTFGSLSTDSSFSINTAGGTGLGAADANGGGGGGIVLVGNLLLSSGDSTRTKVILNTQGGSFTGAGNNGLGGNITVTGTVTGTPTTSNTLDLRYGNGTATLGDASADTITLGTLITAADDARSDQGNLIINGKLDIGTLTTFARGYGIQIKGGGTIDNTVTFNNNGVVAIGNASEATVFTGGLDATLASSTRLQGLIMSGDVALSSGGAPMSFGAAQLVGNSSFDTNGGNLKLGSINGAFDLTFLPGIAAGIVDISSTMGATTRLGAITVSAGITQPVIFRDSVRATSLAGGVGTAMDFFGNVNLTGAAVLQGLTTLDNTLYASQNSVLDFTVGAASSLNDLVLASGPVRLGGDGNYTLSGSVNGNQNFKLAGAGTKLFLSNVGSASAPLGTGVLGIEQADGSGTVTFEGDVFTSGASIFGASVVLSGMTYTSADRVDFGGNIFDTVTLEAGTVTLAGTGEKFFNGTLGSTTGLVQGTTSGKVTFQENVTGTGPAGTFSLAGDVEFAGLVFSSDGAVTLAKALTLSSGPVTLTGGGAYNVSATVNGAQNLVLAGAGSKSFSGVMGGATAIGTGAGAALTISGGNTTFGTLTTASGVASTAPLVLNGNVQILGTGDTDSSLGGTVTLAGITVTSGLGFSFGNVVTLTGTTTTLAGTGSYQMLGNIVGTSGGDQAQSLAYNSSGVITFGGTIGTGGVRLKGLNQSASAGEMEFLGNVFTSGSSSFAGDVILSGITFDANGTTSYNTVQLAAGAVTLTGSGVLSVVGALTGNGFNLDLAGTGARSLGIVNGVGTLNIATSGTTTLGGSATASEIATGIGAGALRLGSGIVLTTTLAGVNLNNAASITTLGNVDVNSAGDQSYDSILILGGNLAANAGVGNQVAYGSVSGVGNMTTTAQAISVTPTTVLNQGTFTAIRAGGGAIVVGTGGNFMDEISLGAVRSTGGMIVQTTGQIDAANFTAGTSLTLDSSAGDVNVLNVSVPGTLGVVTGAVSAAAFNGSSSASGFSLDAGTVNALTSGILDVPSLGNITLRQGGQTFSYTTGKGLTVTGPINVGNGNVVLAPAGNFVNSYAGNPFTAGSTRILTRDLFTYPNSGAVPGLTLVFGATSPSQLGANQIGVTLPLLAGSAAPFITEFTTGTGQPYILATQENAVPSVMMPVGYSVAGAYPTRVSYSEQELEVMSPEERSAYEAQQRRQSARVLLQRNGGQEQEIGVPTEGEIPQAKASETVPPAPTARVDNEGKPLAGLPGKEKKDSTQLLRLRPGKAMVLRGQTDSQEVLESERLAAEVNVGSAPVVTR